MNYDLEERTAKFGENVIKFLKTLSPDHISRPVISQMTRSSTSIGANYMEANQASSKKDFYNKIRISQKEANESKHWLRMLAALFPKERENLKIFWKEAHELTLIFAKISSNSKKLEID